MKVISRLMPVLGAVYLVAALPSMEIHNRQTSCSSPGIRKSWKDASDSEKKAYLDAAVCLTTKPSRLGHTGTTLHDDFAWVHNALNRDIHGVAAFLPWHRLFVHTYEGALKSECGYTGRAMYWDWVHDSAAPSKATVWNAVLGFGGNGSSPDGTDFSYCVRDGPFANLQVAYWKNDTIPHCIQREFTIGFPQDNQPEMIGAAYSQSVIDGIFSNTNFLTFHGPLETGPHGAVHAGISGAHGDMGPLTSPNDPIFFLHHTQVDRLWWLWQQKSSARTLDFAGNVNPDELGSQDATLDDNMKLLGLAPDRKVRDFMDTKSAELCYGY